MLANYHYYPQVPGPHRLDLQPQFLHQKEIYPVLLCNSIIRWYYSLEPLKSVRFFYLKFHPHLLSNYFRARVRDKVNFFLLPISMQLFLDPGGELVDDFLS